MRRLILLLFVVLVIAAIADARHKGKKRSKKFSLKGLKLKRLFGFGGKKTPKHNTHKQNTPKHHTYHTHTSSHTHTQQIIYNINIKRKYKHEVHCAKHCVPDTAYWKGDHCVCHAGLAGAGDLCCTDPEEYPYSCTVRGDPYVSSYMKQSAQVFNPCGQVLAVINAKTSSHQSCHVTIRSADAIEQGIFITNQVEITLTIDGKVGTVILNGDGYYNSLENGWKHLEDDLSTTCFSVHGERVQLLRDRHRKVWTVHACGVLVNFRRDTRGGKPGVCITSKYEFSKRPCDHPKDIVCNRLEEDTKPYDSKATYYLAKSFELNEYLKLRLICTYHGICKNVTRTFNECSPQRKSKAMNTCASILKEKFRSCTFLHRGIEGHVLFRKFADCMQAYCDGNQQWCYDEMKTEGLFFHCKADGLHCCDFNRHGGGGGGQQQISQVLTKW